VLVAALAAYANSLGNGFAFDDTWFIAENPVVTEARFGQAFSQAAWPGAVEGTGNYRPLTLSSFAVEWAVWGNATLGYHAVSVAMHALVSLLVLSLLACFVPVPAALVGGLFFAVHPVHTEAVANVMGRAELYAAIGYLGACLLYLRWRPVDGARRGARLLALMGLFLLGVGSKEIAVTLPAMLMLLEAYGRDGAPFGTRLRAEGATYLGLLALMGCYVIVRWNALGDVTGESAAAGLLSLTPAERVLTALTVWPDYLRLMVFPLDLVADYGPNVLRMTTTVTWGVLLGLALLVGAVAGAVGLRRAAPVVALGLGWFVIAVSPVSNLLVRSDILLAERTLYLPSVGATLVVAGLAARVGAHSSARLRRVAVPVAFGVGTLFLARTVDRNPAWSDTFTMLTTLSIEHPESWLAYRNQAIGLRRVGEMASAAEAYEAAMEIAPDHYQLLVDAAVHYHEWGRPERAEELLRAAIDLKPNHTEAYRRLAEHRLLAGDGRAAHAIALQGLVRATDHPVLWALVSESYVAKGDLEAAVRARRAALARDSLSASGWTRLGELYDAMGRDADARDARRRADALEHADPGRG